MKYLITYDRAIQVLKEKFNLEINDTDLRHILPPDPERKLFFVSVDEKYLKKQKFCNSSHTHDEEEGGM